MPTWKLQLKDWESQHSSTLSDGIIHCKPLRKWNNQHISCTLHYEGRISFFFLFISFFWGRVLALINFYSRWALIRGWALNQINTVNWSFNHVIWRACIVVARSVSYHSNIQSSISLAHDQWMIKIKARKPFRGTLVPELTGERNSGTRVF